MLFAEPKIVVSIFDDKKLAIAYPYTKNGKWIHKEDFKEIINKKLESLKKLQLKTGSKDSYGHGLYNGLELARIILTEETENKFLNMEEYIK